MKRKYSIIVDGCDAETEIEIEMTDKEFVFLNSIAEKITTASEPGCMPRMSVSLIKGDV
jgi:hypothetical protein